ncbi:hypothetical protein PALA50_01188 [Pseudomonas aeruginosa]|nr:hypothetical protein PALA50_01188 [Pseudomonas aeruginosa]
MDRAQAKCFKDTVPLSFLKARSISFQHQRPCLPALERAYGAIVSSGLCLLKTPSWVEVCKIHLRHS